MANIKIMTNYNSYTNNDKNYDYKHYLETLLNFIGESDENDEEDEEIYIPALKEAIKLGPEEDDYDIKTKIRLLCMIDNGIIPNSNEIELNYGEDFYYTEGYENDSISLEELRRHPFYNIYNNKLNVRGGSRRIKATPKSKPTPKSKAKPKAKHDEMTMKDIKEMCKANQIKLSKVVEGKRVAFKKKELITKLKRKKLL